MRLVSNMLGQTVNADADLAAGYYIYLDSNDGDIPGGCGGLPQGFIELGNGQRIKTCGGNVETEYLPDFVLIDDWFKPMLIPLLIASIVLTVIAIYRNVS